MPSEKRPALWKEASEIVERYLDNVAQLRVAPPLDVERLRSEMDSYTFAEPVHAETALRIAEQGLTGGAVHTPHPRYWGLFNPATTPASIAGDFLVAAFNPQIAAWSHSPWAAEVERHLIRSLGERFGYRKGETDGTFCSGGMEANHSAILCALVHAYPDFLSSGLRALPAQPILYVSSECHHSFQKAARMCGLGAASVRHIAVDEDLRMSPSALGEAIDHDRRLGFDPFMIAGTAGTTNAGAVDPLSELAQIARQQRLWFHVDAAWGGAAILHPDLHHLLSGIEQADSITFDAHKWLSVPMGAGMMLTRHLDILERTFAVRTAYMPKEAEGLEIHDPHLHSMQWSRRFIGLKLFLSLLVSGWQGYENAIVHQTDMGRLIRIELSKRGWMIANRTDLPVVCFTRAGLSPNDVQAIALAVVASGQHWISTTVLGGRETVLRACVTNYKSRPDDVRSLADVVTAVYSERQNGAGS